MCKRVSHALFLIITVLSVFQTPITSSASTLRLNRTSAKIERGQSIRLRIRDDIEDISYSTKQTRIVKIHSSGFIVGLKPGKAKVIVRSEGQTATCRIQVVKPTIRLSKKHIRLSKGSNQILPVWVSSGYHPHFKSTNRQIATVDDLGRVYAKRKGKANIKVSLDGVTKQCNVIIY